MKKIFSIFILFICFLISVYSESQFTILAKQGRCFYHKSVYTVGDGETLNFLIDYSTHTSGSGMIIAVPGLYSVSNDLITVKIYSGSDYTGGDAVTFYSTTPEKGISFETSVTSNATGSDLGTLIETMEVGTNSTNQNAGGGKITEGIDIRISNAAPSGLLVISNDTDNDINITFLQVFYEY